ncbi:hypothetical protein [Paenibacillus sp. OV219]|uniref:hypothetical protein n=1 Tax=Paenibacillus sp. OV219 TaxID=1884377 RepID=UPI0008BB759B|nr:hypothetical protein [Paenibacillus sp. OV219]SEN94422.1 hypothetical protein SAMN05518847_10521 [Paenibacillus sp. OV219]
MKLIDRYNIYFLSLSKITVFLSNGRIVRGHIIQLHDDFLSIHDRTYGPIDIPFQSVVAVAPMSNLRKRTKKKRVVRTQAIPLSQA